MNNTTEAFYTAVQKYDGISYTRLQQIPFVGVVETLDDTTLWAHKKELGLRGLIITNPFHEEERIKAAQALIDFLYPPNLRGEQSISASEATARKHHESPSTNNNRSNHPLMENEIKIDIESASPDDLTNALSHNASSEDSRNLTLCLLDAFIHKAQVKGEIIDSLYTVSNRVNSIYPESIHNHQGYTSDGMYIEEGDKIIAYLQQKGLIIYHDESLLHSNGNLVRDEDGNPVLRKNKPALSHQVQEGQAIILDHSLYHSAAKKEGNWEEKPRALIMLG